MQVCVMVTILAVNQSVFEVFSQIVLGVGTCEFAVGLQ